MPIAKLDSAFCTTATCPEGKDKIDYYDETLAGLILTVQQTGRKTLSLRYRDEHNRQRQYKLGNFPDISFDKATLLAAANAAADHMGTDWARTAS